MIAQPQVDAAVDQLRARGERITEARRAVLEVLATSREHLDAESVAARVNSRAPGVHRATVYRTLQSLTELGIIAHTHVPGRSTIYHLAPAATDVAHAHAHLQCSTCSRFFDFPVDWLDPTRARVLTEIGFAIDPQHAALLGVCATCREAEALAGGGS